MAVAAGYSFGYVHSSLFLPDNPEVSLSNVQNSTFLFATEVIGWVIILMTDLLVSWSLYKFFAPVDRKISAFTGVVRGVYSIILAFAIFHLIAVWPLSFAADPDSLAIFITAFENYWSFGLIIFGIHLIGLGYLSLKSKTVPKWMGYLLYIAGVSYTMIHGAKAFTPEAEHVIGIAEMILGAPMAIAELGFAVWLIWKGGKASMTQPPISTEIKPFQSTLIHN